MRARDIMLTSFVTVPAESSVQDVSDVLRRNRLSAVPVVGADGALLGSVSKKQLMRLAGQRLLRRRAGPEARSDIPRSPHDGLAGSCARDVMLPHPTAVDADATLDEVARSLDKHRAECIHVVRAGKLVGIVTRSSLRQGPVAHQAVSDESADDREIKSAVLKALSERAVCGGFLRVAVADGVVCLSGVAGSDAEKQMACRVAEKVPGVERVQDDAGVLSTIRHRAAWG